MLWELARIEGKAPSEADAALRAAIDEFGTNIHRKEGTMRERLPQLREQIEAYFAKR